MNLSRPILEFNRLLNVPCCVRTALVSKFVYFKTILAIHWASDSWQGAIRAVN
jgi:hypothetical protein